jgi:hypothetical protein
MEESSEQAEVFRGAKRVARAVVTVRGQLRLAVMPLAGSQAVGFKDVSTQGPTTARFEEPEPPFGAELERLQDGARDIEVGRRDRQWRPEPVVIRVAGETYEECALDRPLNPYGPLAETEFVLRHPDL